MQPAQLLLRGPTVLQQWRHPGTEPSPIGELITSIYIRIIDSLSESHSHENLKYQQKGVVILQGQGRPNA